MLVANPRETGVTVTDDYLANNANYASDFKGPLPLPPSKNVAVLACMDARIDVYRVLGINEGESHVIRNAGGVVTDDAIRSLAISQRLLGTREIVLIHHTECGMLTFSDDEFKDSILSETGIKPEWAAEAFGDLDVDVRQSIARIKSSPFVPHTDDNAARVLEHLDPEPPERDCPPATERLEARAETRFRRQDKTKEAPVAINSAGAFVMGIDERSGSPIKQSKLGVNVS